MIMVYNIACGRQPVYELEHWATRLGEKVLPGNGAGQGLFNDDRFGRALDNLYLTDMASLTTMKHCITKTGRKAVFGSGLTLIIYKSLYQLETGFTVHHVFVFLSSTGACTGRALCSGEQADHERSL
jgi:hypothetical protein